ncbi:MAG: hypothetical protein ACRBBJ_08975 [Rhodomicrobiaceae bacterium]
MHVEHDDRTGHLKRVSYLDEDGNLHNPIDPALKIYNTENGLLSEERWMFRGVLQREESLGAAWKIYDSEDTGNLQTELFYAGGLLHRYHGDAIFHYNSKNGEIVKTEFYKFGKQQDFPSNEIEPK